MDRNDSLAPFLFLNAKRPVNPYNLVSTQNDRRIHMTHTHCIKKMLGIEDPNIHLDETPVIFEKIKQAKNIVVQGKLSYTPRCCKNCGGVNSSHQDIIKNGTKLSTIKLTHINFQPVLLRLKKQRFLCKHCEQTFGNKSASICAIRSASSKLKKTRG